MKKTILYSGVLIAVLASCNLDEFPLDEVTPENFFKTETDLQLYTNGFYSMFPGASTYYAESTDITVGRDLPDEIRGARLVQNTGGGWTWTDLRRINYYLEHSSQCSDASARERYDALARFFRAYFYYGMVKKFGEVPWYDYVLTDNAPGLTAPRTPRDELLGYVLEDIDYAIEHLPSAVSVNAVNRWTALALKSRICLFEGTFRKYHSTEESPLPDADSWLQEAADAAEELVDKGPYSLHSTGNPSTDYQYLFTQNDAFTDEIILAKSYGTDGSQYHDCNYFRITSSAEILGLEKAFVNSYLMKNGKRFTDKTDYETMTFTEEVVDRDPRLAQTIRTPGYTRIGQTQQLAPDLSLSITGYTIIKYLSGEDNDSNQKDISDMPVFRLAEAMLNLAEAKAELGTLTQDDLDKTVNKLRERVGMTGLLNMGDANKEPDQYLKDTFYPNVTGENEGVILEIRRERTIELVQEGFRYDDMIRWKCGKTFECQFEGMYFPGTGPYDLDNDGNIDLYIYEGSQPAAQEGVIYKKLGEDIFLKNGSEGGCIQVNPQILKTWDEGKDYFWPIPVQDRLLNPNLTQNPGWDDGLSY